MTETQRRRYIIENFERAMSEGWLKVWYQPVVRGSNGRVCSEEALSRWAEPGKDIIYPDAFVPVLEEAGLTGKLDLYVLDRVLEDFGRRSEAGLYILIVTVTVIVVLILRKRE